MRTDDQIILGNGAFAECGRPTRVYWDQHTTRLAIVSTFNFLQWHGRDIQVRRALSYRVSVYDAYTLCRVAVLDLARFPINDIAFHPHRPLVAVATGSYDGGYYYEGALLLWDLSTGEAVSVLDESREVTRCRFDDTSEALHVTLRPPDDTAEDDAGEDRLFQATIARDAWEPMRQGSVLVQGLAITDARGYVERTGHTRQEDQSVLHELQHIAERAGQGYEPRWHVWDVAWSLEGDILAVRNNTALEHWTTRGDRRAHLSDPCDGVQLLSSQAGIVYVNLEERSVPAPTVETHVECINVATGQRTVLDAINFPAALSISASGALLARDTDWRRRHAKERNSERRSRDRVVTPESNPPWAAEYHTRAIALIASKPLDLGHYDIFNHYLRIDGAQYLYFVQGTPPASHEGRWVCHIDPRSLQIKRLFPLDWEPQTGTHVSVNSGVYLHDESGDALVLSYQRSDGRGLQNNGSLIMRRHLQDGRILWVASFDAPVTALAAMPGYGVIVFALNNGHLGVLSATTGKVELLRPVALDGVMSVYLSLAATGNRIAAGTIDGRIVVSDFVE